MKKRPSWVEPKFCRAPSKRMMTSAPSKPLMLGVSPVLRGPPVNSTFGTKLRMSSGVEPWRIRKSPRRTTDTMPG